MAHSMSTIDWLLVALELAEATAVNDVHAIEFTLSDYDRDDLGELTNAQALLTVMALGGQHALHHTPRLRRRILAMPPDPEERRG